MLEVAKSTDDAAVKKMQELLRAGANLKAKEPEVRIAHSIRCAAVSGRHGRAAQRQGPGGRGCGDHPSSPGGSTPVRGDARARQLYET